MWIARDKEDELYIYEDKPIRGSRTFERDKTITFRYTEVASVFGELNLFSEVTWENSPLELIIKTEESEMIRTDKELVEEVFSHLDGIKDTVDRMTSGNFMHHKASIKFSANTISKVLELMGLNVH